MNGEELLGTTLGLMLGVYALVAAYRATQTGEIGKPGDDPDVLNSRKEPDAFVNQLALYLLGGILGIGFAVWRFFEAFSH